MSNDEALIGSLAILLAIAAFAIAVGPWNAPYRLRSFAAVQRRHGKSAARGVWIAVAIALMTAGLAIVNGIRPPYAKPAQQTLLDR